MEEDNNRILRIIYKQIVPGDLRKFVASSNDAPSGGGARDLRFSPADKFFPVFQRMFAEVDENGNLHGYFCWDNYEDTEVCIYSPTASREHEVRIGRINKCFPQQCIPSDADDCILILLQGQDLKVWPYFISKYSLENDPWHPKVKDPILEHLNEGHRSRKAAMGYIDYQEGESYTNG